MPDDEVLDELRREASSKQRHATFFSWHDRSAEGKAIAELGVLQSLLESMEAVGCSEFQTARQSNGPWPDCEAETLDGQIVGFEVTELVDEKARAGKREAAPWDPERIIDLLNKRLAIKDARGTGGSGFRQLITLIHTDEFYLSFQDTVELLSKQEFRLPHGNTTRAFLLFSYMPAYGRCPFVELRLAA